jgi:hypothetical protein
MAKAFNHLGYFPFCVGVEPEFKTNIFFPSTIFVDAYNAVIKMSLQDAMALYWKARSARVVADFSWTGVLNFGPPFPAGLVETGFSLNVDTELNFYNQSNKQNEPRERVCFDQQENEPLIAAEFPVSGGGSMEFYLTCFFNRIPYRFNSINVSRVFVKSNQEQPQNKQDEVYVNMFFLCRQVGEFLYSGIRIENRPYEYNNINSELLVNSTINVIINGNTYNVQTLTRPEGTWQGTPIPSTHFDIVINTIEDFV